MYMAPEQLLPNWGEVTATNRDVYSMGVVLYELIEHRTPRHGKSYAEIMSSILHERQANRMPGETGIASLEAYHRKVP